MTEWFVSSAVLAAILIALRFVLREKISPRMQYGLWALLLIRLLIPFSVGQSAVSVENIVPAAEHRVLYLAQHTARTTAQASPEAQAVPADPSTPESADLASGAADPKKVLSVVWFCGAAAVFCWFLGCDLACRYRTRVSLLSAATTMSGRGGQLRSRIHAITQPVKPALPALFAAVLIATLAAGCTMTGGIPCLSAGQF